MLKSLAWQINFPTMATWTNCVSLMWDEFASTFQQKFNHDLTNKNIRLPQFRSNTNEEYYFFRNYYQVIDFIVLDLGHLQYCDKFLVISTLYLLFGLFLKHFSVIEVIKDFTVNSGHYSTFYELNIIFNRFLNKYIGVELENLIDHIQYTSFFFNLKFDYNPPKINPEHEARVIAPLTFRVPMKSFCKSKLIINVMWSLWNISLDWGMWIPGYSRMKRIELPVDNWHISGLRCVILKKIRTNIYYIKERRLVDN